MTDELEIIKIQLNTLKSYMKDLNADANKVMDVVANIEFSVGLMLEKDGE